MEKEKLIIAADELNEILFDPDKKELGWIETDIEADELLNEIKHGALWLYATDELSDETAEVLREIPWDDSDFENLKEDQDPTPAFIRYGIIEEPEVEEEPEKPPKKKAKKEDDVPEYTEAPPPTPKPKKGASAYSYAIAVMCDSPNMHIHDLYDAMTEKGFDIKLVGNSVKTARSIFRRCFVQLQRNGFINEDKLKG